MISGESVWTVNNPYTLIDRTHPVVLGIRLEHLEHAPRRIWAGFSNHIHSEIWFFEIFSRMVWITIDPRTPLDRARRVVLGTRLEHLEHVPGRIWAGFSK